VSLELRALVKHYHDPALVRAVDGVSFTISPGEFVALYGPSGSGKTTLLELIAGILEPDEGTIRFNGTDITTLSRKEKALYLRRDVGLISQSVHLMPTSALNNAASKLLADRWALREARDAARPWLERVGLGARAAHRPDELSMGERQRVAIARALASSPGLLLADEPTGNLDSERSEEVLALLRDISHDRDIPALIVTHDAAAAAFVDRVHSLRDGKLCEDGVSAPPESAEPASSTR
jgi:putative ABC transport system ATP-binding protein